MDLSVAVQYATACGRVGAGEIYVIKGEASLHAPDGRTAQEAADWVFGGASANENLGYEVSMGDLNADGRADIVAGAPNFKQGGCTGAGCAYAVIARPTMPAAVDMSSADLAAALCGTSSFDNLGSAVEARDLDDDGPADFLAAAPSGDPVTQSQAGWVQAIGGHSIAGSDDRATLLDLEVWSAMTGDQAGSALAVGDVTGDQVADFIIGAPRADGVFGRDSGRVFVLAGPLDLGQEPTLTPTFTGTATPTTTPTTTLSPTATETYTATATDTPSPTLSPTAAPTMTAILTATSTPSRTSTNMRTSTPTKTATHTPTALPEWERCWLPIVIRTQAVVSAQRDRGRALSVETGRDDQAVPPFGSVEEGIRRQWVCPAVSVRHKRGMAWPR